MVRFLISTKTNEIFPWTELLEERRDMEPYDRALRCKGCGIWGKEGSEISDRGWCIKKCMRNGTSRKKPLQMKPLERAETWQKTEEPVPEAAISFADVKFDVEIGGETLAGPGEKLPESTGVEEDGFLDSDL